MTRTVIACILILCGGCSLHAARKNEANAFVQGRVVSIQRERTQFPSYSTAGSNPSDAPLVSTYYRYYISVRVSCETYVARYDSPLNVLELPFSANQTVPVQIKRHVLHFDVPDDPDITLPIIRRTKNAGPECGGKPKG
jgi:hypothetical protein